MSGGDRSQADGFRNGCLIVIFRIVTKSFTHSIMTREPNEKR